MKEYPARKTMTDAGKVSAAFCQKAMNLIMETDYKLKTSGGDEQQLMEILLLQLAQEAKNG
jgi:DNA polymerase III delta subunit